VRFLTVFASLAAALVAMTPCSSLADRYRRPDRWQRVEPGSGFDGYAMVKGGGMMLSGAGASSGGYFGLEVGRNAARWFDAGVSIDWYHRRSRDVELLFETEHGFDPPLRGEVTRFESSTDFVPIGLTARLRLPAANAAVVPFVSGTVAYEILHMSFFDRDPIPQPYDELLGRSQTLLGFGWQIAGGVEWAVAANAGLFGEAGMHWSDPSRQLDAFAAPVDVTASLHGGFLRAGLRVSM
jgi:hypothetical protein